MARRLVLALALATVCGCAVTPSEYCDYIILPEQRTIAHRDPSQFGPAPVPPSLPPRTVTDPQPGAVEWQLSLDDAIRIALENARVIRVLAGTSAVSSGQTIYDAAITNTTIDQAQAVFDPVFHWNNTWSRSNTPFGEFTTSSGTGLPNASTGTGGVTAGAAAALRSIITSTPTDTYLSDVGLTKANVLGGKWSLDWTENPTRFAAPGLFPLNPETPRTLNLTYTQPLLQGAGFRVNMAPIVIARLNTEQSYFQYKDSVQNLVLGTIQVYWQLVQARVAVWTREIQERQSKEAYDRQVAILESGVKGSNLGTVSQARVTYYQFRASRIAAEADVLTQEGALRNLLGLPPNDDRRIVPTSAPVNQRLPHYWNALVALAEERRPDIVELKIIVDADRQRLIQAESQALPQLNATASYQWNGLSGTMPNGETISTDVAQFPSWSIGLNFSVPLGLRQGRALVRQQKLIIVRDQANVDQQVHLAQSQLAATLRDLDSAYEQYLAYHETRLAAEVNLRVQDENFHAGLAIYLDVLQARNDWGNAILSEAQQLLVYNTALAALEQETGTILETHGLVFMEERFRAAGPLPCHDRLYPFALPPTGTPHEYPGTGEPSENALDLRDPVERKKQPAGELHQPRRLNWPP
jgi:outer membrane protein TolC